MSLTHAQHNEALCLELHVDGRWNDWVVTTAFYSAMHYVQERLFPLKVKDTEYKDFDDYYSRRTDGSRSQHEARRNLVHVHLHKAYGAHRWLHGTCRTARYYKYQTTKELADQAVLKLNVVKSLCVPSSASSTLPPSTLVQPAEPTKS